MKISLTPTNITVMPTVVLQLSMDEAKMLKKILSKSNAYGESHADKMRMVYFMDQTIEALDDHIFNTKG